MRRRTCSALATLGFAACQSLLSGVPSCAQDKATGAPSKSSNAASGSQSSLRDVAAELTKKLHDDADVKKLKEQRLVIAEFENINGKGDAVPRILQEMLMTAFIKAKHFKVVERKQLDKALEELHFTLSDLTDPDKRKQIGKLVNASYLLVGSIKDTGDDTDIDTRIMSIESGENIAAENASIKQSETSTPSDANPRPLPANDAPKIKVPEKAVPNSAGQYTGKQANFGLFGVAKYKIAWEENLGSSPVRAFSAGEVQGSGIFRLVLAMGNESFEYATSCNLIMMKWENERFQQTWKRDADTCWDPVVIRIVPREQSPATIFVSSYYISPSTEILRWNGTEYSIEELPTGTRLVVTDSGVRGNELELIGIQYGNMVVQHRNIDNILAGVDSKIQIPADRNHWSPLIQADFDGDGKMEFATVEYKGNNTPASVEVFKADGTRKAITVEEYNDRLLTRWQPRNVKYPYIVVTRNTQDEAKKPNGGYVCFVQWNGENYKEVFKSNKLHDAIIDVQVCDPKGERTTGLVILSADKKGYYLTKIVPEK